MKTLYSTLKKTTGQLNLSKPVLRSFSKEFTSQYEDFLSDFIFSSTNNTYSVYNGLFITKVKQYFKELYDKYDFTDNKLLLSTAFVYQFFIELEGKYASHSYRVMTPFTLEELLDVSNREKSINLTNLKVSYKNVKDIGNAALFITLVSINNDFNVKLKEIDTCVTKFNLNFMFNKSTITGYINPNVESTIDNVLVRESFITSENLALIQFMQVFILEDIHVALCSVRTSPKTIAGRTDLASTVKSSYYAEQTLLDNVTSINLLFPEVINNRVSLFNVILGNSQGLLENLHKRNLSSPTTLYLLQLAFIEVINRFTTVLLNPTDKTSEILNMFYTKVVGEYGEKDFRLCSHESQFFHIDLSGLTEMRDNLIGYNSFLVDGEMTRYGLTNIIENTISVNIINSEFDDFDFTESELGEEIEVALNKVLEVYDVYSKFTKQLNIISVDMLKLEGTIKRYDSRSPSIIEPLLEDEKFLSSYYSAPFFIMNALTSVKEMTRGSLPVSIVNGHSFFEKYSKHLESDISKKPFSFFLESDNFDQIEYLNTLLALEIKSQIMLLQHFPQYYLLYGDMIKFRINLKSGQNSSYGASPKYSFIVPTMCKALPVALHRYLLDSSTVNSIFTIFALDESPGCKQGIEQFMANEYLLRQHSSDMLEQYPQLELFITLVYRLVGISRTMFRVFGVHERNSDRIFDVRLAALIKEDIVMFRTVKELLTTHLDKITYYTYDGFSPTVKDFFVAVEKKPSLSPLQKEVVEVIKEVNELLTQENVIEVLVTNSFPAVLVSTFNEKVAEILLMGCQQFTTHIESKSNNFSILDSVIQLLSCDAAKTENIYEEKIKSIMNGNNIISNHARTLALKAY